MTALLQFPDALTKLVDLDNFETMPAPGLTGGWPSPVSAADLCANPPETPPELIHGLLYRRGTMLLSGASKSYKTYTMLAAGIAIASGREWLGFKTSQCPVLYLNLELQDFATKDRVHSISRAMGILPPQDLHLVNLRGVLANITDFETNVADLIARLGAGMVVVDPHYKLSSASGVEENSNDDQAAFLYRIENAVTQAGAAVMIAHHFAKGDASAKRAIDRAAGGGALARWGDVVMTLTDHEQPGHSVAEFSLRNFAPIPAFVLKWTHPLWVPVTSGIDPTKLKKAAGRNNEHPAEELMRFLKDGMTRPEWRAASGWSETTHRNKVSQLEQQGRVRYAAGLYYANPPQSP
jgi:hypothetical protein